MSDAARILRRPIGDGAPAIRRGSVADGPACARILQAWLDATPWMPNLHSSSETERFITQALIPSTTFLVAEVRGAPAGYLALGQAEDAPAEVRSLTVASAHRNAGIGGALLRTAQDLRPDGLRLWTFAANVAAQRFYSRHGFEPGRRRDGGRNEEGLPDIEMAWPGRARRLRAPRSGASSHD